jgi:FkbM family methyltransferase
MVGPSGRVHTFEPVNYTFHILRRNVLRSDAQNVVCYDYAISDRDGKAEMVVPTYREIPDVRYDNSGSMGRVRNYYAAHLAAENTNKTGEHGKCSIPTRSLDSLFANNPARISLIKCDAEGYELQCMRGAKTILLRDRPALFIELCSDPDEMGSSMWQLIEFLREFGYSPYLYKDGHLQTRPKGMFVKDLFFLTDEQYSLCTGKVVAPSVSVAYR